MSYDENKISDLIDVGVLERDVFIRKITQLQADNKDLVEMLKEFIQSCCGEQECEEELIKGLGNTLYNSVFKAKLLIQKMKQ